MNGQQFEFRIDEAGVRLDRLLSERVPELSRSLAQRLIGNGQVTVNGEPAKASYKTKTGDLVAGQLPVEASVGPVAEKIPLRIIYEDDDLLVVDKQAGMVIHPAPGHAGGTLVNALLSHCPELADSGTDRPGIVHRLDRDTSGLVLVAKREKIRRALQRQFKDRQIRKVYLALLDGHLQPPWGRIEAPIGRNPRHRQRMAVVPGGREAITEYHVLEQFSHRVGQAAGDFTLVEAEPKTGRTHQIRVHFASIGHPVVGDRVYGRRHSSLPLVPRQFLHAQLLELTHPKTGQRQQFKAQLSADLAAVLDLLKST